MLLNGEKIMRASIKIGFNFVITILVTIIFIVGGCSASQNCIKRECELLNNQISIHEIYSYIEKENETLYSKKGIDINNATVTLDCFFIDIINEDGELKPHYIQYKTYVEYNNTRYFQSVNVHENSFTSTLTEIDNSFEINHTISLKDYIIQLDSINLDYFINTLEYGDEYILEYMYSLKTITKDSPEYNSYVAYSYDNITNLNSTDKISFESYNPVISIASLQEVEKNTFKSGDNSYLLVCLAN